MTALTIFLGVVSSALIFYFTSSMLLAQKQLVAATRLAAYLTYWQNWILEQGAFSVYYQGVQWNKEVQEIMKKGGGAAELVELEKEKKKLLDQLKEQIEKEALELDREKLVEEIQRLPKESVGSIFDFSKIMRQNIIEGKTFISDEEATALGVAFTNKSIELKMAILDLLDSGTMLAIMVVIAPADFDVKQFSTKLAELLWKGILASKNIDMLAGPARIIAAKSVVALTLENMRNGTRLTKRR